MAGDAYVQRIFDGLRDLHYNDPTRFNIAFADSAVILDGVLGPDPGYKVFRCTGMDSRATTVGSCNDAEHYFYRIPG